MAISYNEAIRFATGVVQLGVGCYSLRITRLFGTRRVGWFLFSGFVLMALGNLTEALIARDSLHYTVPLLMLVIPALRFIGMIHIEELLRERVLKNAEVSQAKDELKRRFDEQSVNLQRANDALKK